MSEQFKEATQGGTRKVFQALIDPRWTAGLLEFDGKQFICVTLSHPEHGKIECLLARSTAGWLAEILTKLATP